MEKIHIISLSWLADRGERAVGAVGVPLVLGEVPVLAVAPDPHHVADHVRLVHPLDGEALAKVGGQRRLEADVGSCKMVLKGLTRRVKNH